VSRKPSVYAQLIADYDKATEKWRGTFKKILKRYRAEGDVLHIADKSKFPMLWSNVETLSTATFARVPQPDVRRRHDDTDEVGRVAALLLERILDYEVADSPDYASALALAIKDRFLGGRGTVWVRYEPRFKENAISISGPGYSDDVQEAGEKKRTRKGKEASQSVLELDYECSPVDYVNWDDFGHSVARTWEEVEVVWRKVYLGRSKLVERFGDIGNTVPLTDPRQKSDDAYRIDAVQGKRACVWEIWDKTTKEAVWLAGEGKNIELDRLPDPFHLEDFFPCPRPLYGTLTSDTLVPVPDYIQYQDKALDLDVLSDRISGLIHSLQVKGVYDASQPELSGLLTQGTSGDLIPVKNWARLAEQGGVSGALSMLDIRMIIEALASAYTAFEQVKDQIYEITGISDIRRGRSDPNETLGAQQLKAGFSGLREKRYQDDIASFATDVIRLKAQFICGQYNPRTILDISAARQLTAADQQLVPQALELLLGARMMYPDADPKNPLRDFRVEIAADSMIYRDEQQEKSDRVELLTAMSQYLTTIGPLIQAVPQSAPLLLELMKFAVSSFRGARQIQGTIDGALQEIQQGISQGGAMQKPNPQMLEQMRQQVNAEVQQQHAGKSAQLARQEADLGSREAALQTAIKLATLEKQVQQGALAADAQISATKLQALKTEVGRLVQQLDQKLTELQSTNSTDTQQQD
jgi:hypothetical protein